ncbi:MAG: hypothetical protein M0Z95_22720 [Actinomycetota bacterium]|nr:hypothetical protein [Actinomycetota bacterium]
MSTTPTRQPAGVPTGGQFAARSNPECEIDLGAAGLEAVTGDDAPTVVHPDGSEEWYQHGERPSPAGPLVEADLSGSRRVWLEDGEEVPPPVGTEINVAEARALPSYTEVAATFDVTGDREFRLLARDLPRWSNEDQPGRGSDAGISRRFTNLDTGSEVFVGGGDGVNSPGSSVILTRIRVTGHP